MSPWTVEQFDNDLQVDWGTFSADFYRYHGRDVNELLNSPEWQTSGYTRKQEYKTYIEWFNKNMTKLGRVLA